MQFMLLFSRQGKLRLQKWYVAHQDKMKKKITRELVTLVLSRKPKMCSFLEWRDLKVVYKRYFVKIFETSLWKHVLYTSMIRGLPERRHFWLTWALKCSRMNCCNRGQSIIMSFVNIFLRMTSVPKSLNLTGDEDQL